MTIVAKVHPYYGPCDALLPDGGCAECQAQRVGYRGPLKDDDLQPRPRLSRHGKIGRLKCDNFECVLSGGVNSAGEQVRHPVIISVARTEDGALHEVVIEGRGKIGQGKDLMLHDLSIAMSRIIQERDPETGEHLGD